MNISHEEAKALITKRNSGRIFTVSFVKRSTGEVRKMNCRKGVKKGTNGEGLKFDPISRGLVPVFDMQKNQHRFISLDDIREIKADKQEYQVV